MVALIMINSFLIASDGVLQHQSHVWRWWSSDLLQSSMHWM